MKTNWTRAILLISVAIPSPWMAAQAAESPQLNCQRSSIAFITQEVKQDLSPDQEAAQATIKAMLALAIEEKWGSYIDNYYGEIDKVKTPAQRDRLIDKFSDSWGLLVRATLAQAATIIPTLEGDQAIFAIPLETLVQANQDNLAVYSYFTSAEFVGQAYIYFRLHQDDSGEFKFHL